MAGTIGVIGLVAGIFQNIVTPTSWLAPQDSSKTRIRVYAGLATEEGKSTSGNVPGVAAWDVGGNFIGKAMGIYNYVVEEGKSYDLEIKGTKSSADYISVSAFGKDGLCVAAVGVTSPTGYRAGWFGDIGMKCGAPWYPSNFAIPGSDPEVRPACVWIDQDGTNNHPHKSITMHMPDFQGEALAKEYNDNIDTVCKSLPRFSMWLSRTPHMTLPFYNPPLQYNEDGSDKDIDLILAPKWNQSETTAPNDPTGTKLGVAEGASAEEPGPITELKPSKRRVRRQSYQPLHDQLVVSDLKCHSATELCDSETSAGPDFVSTVEGLFCDMSEKMLWPLCSEDVHDACFDLESKTIRLDGVGHGEEVMTELKARGLGTSEKVYRNVQNWS